MAFRSDALELAKLDPKFGFLPLNGNKRPLFSFEIILSAPPALLPITGTFISIALATINPNVSSQVGSIIK